MKHFFKRHIWVRKLLVTFVILLVFLLGRQVPLPGLDLQDYITANDSFFNISTSITGGNLSSIAVFSLGLGPWMYAMILLRIANIGRRSKGVTQKMINFKQNMLMLIIAIIQGLGIAITLQSNKQTPLDLPTMFGIVLILAAGAFVIAWLGNMNSAFGIGGTAVIVVSNMLVTQFANIPLLAKLLKNGYHLQLAFLLVWTILSIFFLILFERSEYRIPVMRSSIHNRLVDEAYMPIKVLASGGMPLMYVYSILSLPQYLILFLQIKNPKYASWSAYFTTTHIIGLMLYIVLLIALAVAFALINIDPTKLSEDMRRNGDFIDHKRPGKETKAYLQSVTWFFGLFSGFFLVMLCAVPLLLTLGNKDLQSAAQLIGIVIMVTGILLMVKDEVSVMRIRKQYTSLFEE